MSEEAVRKSLQNLVQAIHSAVDEGLKEGTLQPDYMRYIRWKVTEFEYDDTGFKRLGRQGEEFQKPFYSKAGDVIFQNVIKQDIYKDTHKGISEYYRFGEGQSNDYLHRLITRLTTGYLAGETKTVVDMTKYIGIFLEDLDKKKHECRAEVRLKGLIIRPDVIST